VQRGKVNTDWKKRWFILHNRDRNYELEYREGGITLKGSIPLVGITVHSGPDNTLTLEPSDRSRIYYLKAESRDDQKKWKYMLQVCV
jgi:PH domain